jgi:arabinogalactan endo-1,4-beta-galactosidase
VVLGGIMPIDEEDLVVGLGHCNGLGVVGMAERLRVALDDRMAVLLAFHFNNYILIRDSNH